MPATVGHLDSWADLYVRQRRGRGAVFYWVVRYGFAADFAADVAEDAVQEALGRVLEKYGSCPGHYTGGYEHFRHSVTRIAIRIAANYLRRLRRCGRLPDGVEAVAEEADQRPEAVRVCRELLPEHQQELLRLKWDDEWTLDEMAERLLEPGGSPNARRLRIFRAQREALAALLALLRERYPELDWETPTWVDDL